MLYHPRIHACWAVEEIALIGLSDYGPSMAMHAVTLHEASPVLRVVAFEALQSIFVGCRRMARWVLRSSLQGALHVSSEH